MQASYTCNHALSGPTLLSMRVTAGGHVRGADAKVSLHAVSRRHCTQAKLPYFL